MAGDRPWVVVGLGNPGPRYEATRHNIGFRLLAALAPLVKAGSEEAGPNYRVARGRIGDMPVVLLRPLTYMNRSGDALSACPESGEAGPERHLVLLDDVALPFRAVRFRARGSDGGHNGLASVLDRLGTADVPRLRLGVGDGEEGRDLADYVLGPFTGDEEKEIPAWLEHAARGVIVYLTEGPQAAMNRFNG